MFSNSLVTLLTLSSVLAAPMPTAVGSVLSEVAGAVAVRHIGATASDAGNSLLQKNSKKFLFNPIAVFPNARVFHGKTPIGKAPTQKIEEVRTFGRQIRENRQV